MRLDKFLSNMGEGSRSYIKKLVKTGAVTVDGDIVTSSDFKISENQKVCIDGKQVMYIQYVYIMLNKPKGVISATEDSYESTVLDLLGDKFKIFDIFPVGRLDKDTEGLLIITNDGQLSHNLLSPRKHISKKYYAEIDGIVTQKDIEQFKLGIELDDGYLTLPAQLEILESSNTSKVEIVLTEGKYHQIKRMFEALDKKVVYLKRIAMGDIELDPNLNLGEFRYLTEDEIYKLKNRE